MDLALGIGVVFAAPLLGLTEEALAVVSAFAANPESSVALVDGQIHDLESLGRAGRVLARRLAQPQRRALPARHRL